MSDLDLLEGGVDDTATIADIATAQSPDEPVDPVIERYYWEQRTESEAARFKLGRLHGEIVGFALIEHRVWPTEDESRGAYLQVGIRPEAMTPARVRQLIEAGLEMLRSDGARVVESLAFEDQLWLREALVAAGIEQDHLSKRWELDLVAQRQNLLRAADEVRARSRALGLRVQTLADCRLPDKLTRLHALHELARNDVPRSVPALPNPKELFLKLLRMPGTLEDRFWVAELDGELVGMSYLRFPPVRGHVWTGFTASHPEHRGKGIAKAVKMESLVQAIELGIPLVRTDNDERNAPMLRINEQLGYHAIPAWVDHLKRLS